MRDVPRPPFCSPPRRTPVGLVVACGFAAALWVPVAHAQGEKAAACKIIVLNLQGKNLPKADTEIPTLLTETLALEVATVSGCQVLSQQDIGSMLDLEAKKAECGDGSDSCLSEVGSALGADRVIEIGRAHV